MQNSGEKLEADQGEAAFDWDMVTFFLQELRKYYRLLLVIISLFLALVFVIYLLLEPRYTAVAVIGPAAPSPTDALLASGGSSAVSITKRLIGGAGAPSSADPFQEYLQLLHSVRLARVLAEKHNVLQLIYAQSWDASNQRWHQPGAMHAVISVVKRIFHRPVVDAPNVDSLAQFLDINLKVERIGATGGVSSLLAGGISPFSTVSLNYNDPRMAESLLNLILQEADDIIREDQRRDVKARLAYLNREIPNVTLSDQREAMIATLSGQLQLQMMIAADHRFTSTLVDPPHASNIPTWPPGPVFYFVMATMFSIAIWVGLVFLGHKYEAFRRIICVFEQRHCS